MEEDRGCCEEVRRGIGEFQVENFASGGFCVRARRTADPSAALGMTRGEWLPTLSSASRIGRDDKGAWLPT
jgi:hypothetical protein